MPVPGSSADNLCVRAYELLRKDFGLKPVSIHLMKSIPTGAGLGGGSSDGAYALKVLNDIFHLNLSGDRLREYAAGLGSDCAFFIDPRPALGHGRGEVLTPLEVSLKGKFLVIVKPEVTISTAEAFSGISPKDQVIDPGAVLAKHSVAEWKELLVNDFETSIFKRFPVISALKQKLYAFGASYASMSGSGSAVFGIFDSETDLKKEFESVLYWSGTLE